MGANPVIHLRSAPTGTSEQRPYTLPLNPENRLLRALSMGTKGQDLSAEMSRSICQLGQVSGWRWAAVARLLDDGASAQLLALAEDGELVPGFSYEMELTPSSAWLA